jgi:hypothetical protein
MIADCEAGYPMRNKMIVSSGEWRTQNAMGASFHVENICAVIFETVANRNNRLLLS